MEQALKLERRDAARTQLIKTLNSDCDDVRPSIDPSVNPTTGNEIKDTCMSGWSSGPTLA